MDTNKIGEIKCLFSEFGLDLAAKNIDLYSSKLKLDSLYAYEIDLQSKLQSCRDEITGAQEDYFQQCAGVNIRVQMYEDKFKKIIDSMKV